MSESYSKNAEGDSSFRVVVRLGGSLLSLPDLNARLAKWIGKQDDLSVGRTRGTFVWIAGGGGKVDELRKQYASGAIAELDAHWKAIEVMDQNTRGLPDRVENFEPCVDSLDEVIRPNDDETNRHYPLSVTKSLRNHSDLPESWRVTSDSIAAQFAQQFKADELVLLKSRLATTSESSIKAMAELGLVDEHFPIAFQTKRLRIVDFRSDGFDEQTF
jgi:aspartokinase-like uncharacterized kinase